MTLCQSPSGQAIHLPSPVQRGVVHQNVDAPEVIEDEGGHALHVLPGRHVGLRQKALPAQGFDFLFDLHSGITPVDEIDRHVSAGSGQSPGCRAPDTARGAGNQGDFTL